jgi:GGDEF domain-containing protein
MSLQGPLIVVADRPATEFVAALGAAGAFPIVESNWSDAPTAFVAVKPAAIILADTSEPDESAARMLGLQVATANGPIVPVVAFVEAQHTPALPLALPVRPDAARLVARLQSAQRVRALHATVLRRCEAFIAEGGWLPQWPEGDALDDASVLIVGRGALYGALGVVFGERVRTSGALSVDTALKHLAVRDVDGIVIADGLPPRMLENFLAALSEQSTLRDLPVAALGDAGALAAHAPNVDPLETDPARAVAYMLPLLRLHAFEARLKRMLGSLDSGGLTEPATGLLTRDCFFRDLDKAVAEASERSQPLSLARFSFDGPLDPRAGLDAARLATRLTRAIDFATRDEDGAILIAFTQTDLRSAHVVARRIAGLLKTTMLVPSHGRGRLTANVTLASFKAGDTPDTLMLRAAGSRLVAAE